MSVLKALAHMLYFNQQDEKEVCFGMDCFVSKGYWQQKDKTKVFNAMPLNLRGICHTSFPKVDYTHKNEEEKNHF